MQVAYRKKDGQRLIASLRDPYGRREVFSTGSTYVLVDCCNDRDALEHIHKKLDKELIRRHVRLTIVCRYCSGFHGIGGSADEII